MAKFIGFTIALMLIVASPAMAQAPTSDAYGGSGNVLHEVATGSTPSSAGAGPAASGVKEATASGGDANGAPQASFASQPIATTGSLPFTGLDMGLLAAGSVLLVGLGFGLRRFGRRNPAPLA